MGLSTPATLSIPNLLDLPRSLLQHLVSFSIVNAPLTPAGVGTRKSSDRVRQDSSVLLPSKNGTANDHESRRIRYLRAVSDGPTLCPGHDRTIHRPPQTCFQTESSGMPELRRREPQGQGAMLLLRSPFCFVAVGGSGHSPDPTGEASGRPKSETKNHCSIFRINCREAIAHQASAGRIVRTRRN